jgi:hypothetical protein
MTYWIVILTVAAITGLLGYAIGKQKTEWSGFQLEKGDFAASLNTAQKLRAGNSEEALRVIENHCYAIADIL